MTIGKGLPASQAASFGGQNASHGIRFAPRTRLAAEPEPGAVFNGKAAGHSARAAHHLGLVIVRIDPSRQLLW